MKDAGFPVCVLCISLFIKLLRFAYEMEEVCQNVVSLWVDLRPVHQTLVLFCPHIWNIFQLILFEICVET